MKCSIVKGVPFACCFGVAGRMAHLTTCEEVAELIAAYCTCNESGDTCEHGHLARKCEVCELKAEVSRLRSVCRVAAGVVKASTNLIGDRKYVCGALADVGRDLEQAGKEATDGQ